MHKKENSFFSYFRYVSFHQWHLRFLQQFLWRAVLFTVKLMSSGLWYHGSILTYWRNVLTSAFGYKITLPWGWYMYTWNIRKLLQECKVSPSLLLICLFLNDASITYSTKYKKGQVYYICISKTGVILSALEKHAASNFSI
jgi:hypothetical protein